MTETVRMRLADERLIRRIEAVTLIFAAVLAVGAFVLGRAAVAGGIAAGGMISFLNLVWIAAIVRRLLTNTGSSVKFAASLAAKELLLLGAVGALIGLKLVDPIGMLIGLSGLVPAVVVAAAGKWADDKRPKLPRTWSRD